MRKTTDSAFLKRNLFWDRGAEIEGIMIQGDGVKFPIGEFGTQLH